MLLPCYEYGVNISLLAKACPKCGANNAHEPTAIHGMKGCGGALMALERLIPIVVALIAFVGSLVGC